MAEEEKDELNQDGREMVATAGSGGGGGGGSGGGGAVF